VCRVRGCRRALGIAALMLAVAGCGSRGETEIQGITNGGLTAGDEGRARSVAIHQVRRQNIDLTAAIALGSPPSDTGTCRMRDVIRLVLEGSFPDQGSDVKAEDIYIGLLSGRICSSTYLRAVPHLRSDLGTLYIPGTGSTGE
jgi:hypothetical protein